MRSDYQGKLRIMSPDYN